ncbi:hypothetical protein [Rhodoblastus sp.]|jgi:hypothetical protein|uniref:hypothetical protein n=1 Tax=Rhodoblastus sp. TaxID=1962975 RepID=UPI00260BBA05|nr:hypothetical protein [Rhodoblastus sp.]
MKNVRWFGARAATERGEHLVQSFFRFVGLSRAAAPSSPVSGEEDGGAAASWTARLHRGDDLPPCRLSILIGADSCAPMRLEAYRGAPESGARASAARR